MSKANSRVVYVAADNADEALLVCQSPMAEPADEDTAALVNIATVIENVLLDGLAPPTSVDGSQAHAGSNDAAARAGDGGK